MLDYVYQFKDHLGNIRLSYSDSDGNGDIDAATEIIEENNYYPFGLKHKGYNNVVSANANSIAKKFGYNGVENEEALGLNLMEMDMRQYDAATGRWISIDPVTHHSQSTYNGFDNNPIYWSDPSGADSTNGIDDSDSMNMDHWSDAYKNGGNDTDKGKRNKKIKKKTVTEDSGVKRKFEILSDGTRKHTYTETLTESIYKRLSSNTIGVKKIIKRNIYIIYVSKTGNGNASTTKTEVSQTVEKYSGRYLTNIRSGRGFSVSRYQMPISLTSTNTTDTPDYDFYLTGYALSMENDIYLSLIHI